MRRPVPQPDWPDCYVDAFANDRVEVFGDTSVPHHSVPYQNRMSRVLDMVKRYARPGARILDVAAAQGNYTLALAEFGFDVTWNDIRAELADYVKAKYERGMVTYVPGDVFRTQPPGCFDVVLALEIIEHVAHPDLFLQNAIRLVKPGGLLVISTPNGDYCRHHGPRFAECKDPSVYEAMQFMPDADGHIFCLSATELRKLAEDNGLEVVELALFNAVPTMGHCKLRHLHLPGPLVGALERTVQRMPMPVRQLLCAAVLGACRRPMLR